MSKLQIELLEQELVSVFGGRDIVLTFGVTVGEGVDEIDLGTVKVTLMVFQDGVVRYEIRETDDYYGSIAEIEEHFEELL